MIDLNALIHNPVFIYGVFWVLSGLAQTMPEPRADSGVLYVWVHNLFQFLLANIPRMRSSGNQLPPSQAK